MLPVTPTKVIERARKTKIKTVFGLNHSLRKNIHLRDYNIHLYIVDGFSPGLRKVYIYYLKNP